MCNGGLIAVGIAAAVINGAEYRAGIKSIHERARPVVDGLARQQHVVRIHDSVNKTQQLPLGNETGLACHHAVEHRPHRVISLCRFGVMALDNVVHENFEGVVVLFGGKKLEGADTDMTLSDACQYSAWHLAIAHHLITGGGSSQRPGGWHA